MNERLKTTLSIIGIVCICLIGVSTITAAVKPTPPPDPLTAVWATITGIQSDLANETEARIAGDEVCVSQSDYNALLERVEYVEFLTACAAGHDHCGTTYCYDLTKDNNNCGSCGNVCTSPLVCSSGICAP